jgi:uncharacterized protein (DUF2235 family)
MAKNIVVCCDGTGNQFGAENSNVIKLYKIFKCDETQTAYYHPGIGTMGSRNALSRIGQWWTQVIGLAFGYGISDNVADVYQFLMRTYEPGDKIYTFGFSRGAYTARALCGMLHIVGLLTRGNEALIPYAIRLIKEKKIDFAVAADFKKTFSRECKIHFLGLWDTVSSVGWVYNAVHFPFATKNPDFNIVRHAISIDEHRAFFRQNLFIADPPTQDIQQIWFAGVHSDVGGSYAESESQLSKLAFEWIVCEAELAGLIVDQSQKAQMLGADPPYVAPAANGPQHESLKGAWWVAEFWPKIVRIHQPGPDDIWKSKLRMNLARRRTVAKDSCLHVSVEQRMNAVPGYRPKNLCPPDKLRQQYQIVTNRC